MSVLSVAQHWTGSHSIKYLVVFGASYCSVGYNSHSPHPTAEEPLGVTFPGFTYCDQIDQETNEIVPKPNWVGHVVQKVKALRSEEFLPHVGNRSDWAQWSPNDTLFVSWIGINDCGRNIWNPHKGAQSSINELFELYDQLYQSGARNFCLIDVPPLHEYPGRLESSQLKEAYSAWNPLLHAGAQLFISAHDDVTVMIYSSWDFFSRLLKDPVAFGFSEADLRSPRSAIFVDGTHPTTEVHAIIAQELLALWKSIQPQKADTPLPNM